MIGHLINEFDKTNGTVREFNMLFKDSPLDFPDHYEVEIGELFSGVRMLKVNGVIVYHELKLRVLV